MKVHNTLEELLTSFYLWMQENDYNHNIPQRVSKKASIFLDVNSLALGKPEPLAKNKQFDKVCKCTCVRNVTEFYGRYICCICNNPIQQT